MCGGRERLAAARLAAALLLCGCASPAAGPEPALTFPGPGRLAVVWHVGEPDDPPDRHLVVYDEGGAHRLAVEQPREVRWLGPDELLVLQELPAAPGEFAVGRLLRVPLGGAPPAPLLEPRRYYNAEPAPGGSSFAVGVETSDQGESELETWSLRGAEPVRLGRLPHNLDEPRFSPDGDMLVVARMVAPDAEEGFGLSIGGVALPWPRLFAIGSDLAGALTSIHDAGRDAPPVAGGSLPLWWDAAGVYARQRGGVVRCRSPESGCSLVLANPAGRRIVDARPAAGEQVVALLVDLSSSLVDPPPAEIWLFDLASGEGRPLHEARPALHPLDLDWTGAGVTP